MNRFRCSLALVLLIAALQSRVQGQTAGRPVAQGSGPVGGLSTNVGDGSEPVHGSVRRGSLNAGPLSGQSVRGSVTGDVVSGPFSDVSVGPATADNPMAGGGSVEQASAGAVKKDFDSPLGQMIAAPLRDLGPLQERLRAIQPVPRDQPAPDDAASLADGAADATGAMEPASEGNEPVEDAAVPEDAEAAELPAPGESEADQESDPLNSVGAAPATGAPRVDVGAAAR